jgi:hypothetical protein
MREGRAATDKRQEIKVAQQGNPADPINSAADFHVMADFDFCYCCGKFETSNITDLFHSCNNAGRIAGYDGGTSRKFY